MSNIHLFQENIQPDELSLIKSTKELKIGISSCKIGRNIENDSFDFIMTNLFDLLTDPF